jgi:ribonuclease M5
MIKRLAKETGIVILTDSDSAGLRIRNFIKQQAADGIVKHAYVPDIKGKEKRKRKSSAEGLLGVEGMTEEIIINALRESGCEIDGEESTVKSGSITKTDLYMLGLSGGSGSKDIRARLARELGVPTKLSSNMLLDVLNRITDYDGLVEVVQKIKEETV